MSTSRRTSPARDVEAVAARIHSATLHLLRRLRTDGDAMQVSPPRLSALSAIVRAGPITIGDLAALEGVRPPTMTRLVDGLQSDGLVVRRPHPLDRRAVNVLVTAKGSRALEGGSTRSVRALAQMIAGLPPRDLATLRRAADLLDRSTRRDGGADL